VLIVSGNTSGGGPQPARINITNHNNNPAPCAARTVGNTILTITCEANTCQADTDEAWDRRRVMIWSDTAAACGTLFLVGLLWAGALQLWHIYAVTAIGAIANTFQQPAYAAAVAQLVPKPYLGHVNGIVQFEGVLGFMAVLGLSVMVMGLRPAPWTVGVGLFWAGFALTLANAHWLALIQTKVGLELQGRVIATDNMVSLSMQPLGFILAGPLHDEVFAPLMVSGGRLEDSLSWLVGAGPGWGMALMLVLCGALSVGLALWGYRYRRLRFMEDDLPSAEPV